MYDGFIVFLGAGDLQKIHDFYSGLLGCALAIDQSTCRIYQVSTKAYVGFCLHLETKADPTTRSPMLTLVTDRVDEVYTRILSRGLWVDGPPRLNAKYNIYHFFTRDPEGYTVEVQEFVQPEHRSMFAHGI